MRRYNELVFVSFIVCACIPVQGFSQRDSLLIDSRDGQQYRVGTVNGQTWMLDNLAIETSLSLGVPEDLRSLNPDFRGRWYHMHELDSICPEGWRLPHLDDWIAYFDYLSSISEGSYDLQTSTSEYRLTEFNQYFDLFENGNPLLIIPAGIYEGNEFLYAPGSADFWIMDLQTRKEAKGKNFKLVKKSYPGTAHIHLYNQFTHIHSHRDHLEADKPNEMRRFMCRCIKWK